MALKLALITFEFEKLDDSLAFDPDQEYDFSSQDPYPGEGVQPVIEDAFIRIRKCLEKSVSNLFHFGQNTIRNLNNYLHLATTLISAAIQHADGSLGQTSIILNAKFYRLSPNNSYKVSIDLEELPSTSNQPENVASFKHGTMDNDNIANLAQSLDKEFNLNGNIETVPIIRRGRTSTGAPYFIRSCDERILEYDFDQVVFHARSEYQDIKIAISPSLGKMLLLNNSPSFSQEDISYLRALMDYGNICYKNREILILGGGDGALLHELLKENPMFVTLVEIDEVVIKACSQYFDPFGEVFRAEGSNKISNYKVIVEDCLKVLRQSIESGKKYNVIINDLTRRPVCKREESLTAFDASLVQRDNYWHFIEAIFNASMECLEPREGFYLNRTTSRSDTEALRAYEEFLEQSKYELAHEKRYAYVPSRMDFETFYTIQRRK